MREIKFRCWNTKLKRWGGDIVINGLGVKAKSMIYEDVFNRGDEYIVIQYTGLKDKNGKEIYEGDIIKRTIPYSGHQAYPLKVVVYNPRTARFNGLSMTNDMEVVGNVHENSDLLA